jgi:hypothetical protein
MIASSVESEMGKIVLHKMGDSHRTHFCVVGQLMGCLLATALYNFRDPRRTIPSTGNLAVPTFGEVDFTGFGLGGTSA